jgi:hypothetical protein
VTIQGWLTSWWQELKRPATAITVALAILTTAITIIVSLYFYHKAQRHAVIAFKVEQVQVFDKGRTGGFPLTILDAAGNRIDNNIYAAGIAIWNHGNTEIRQENVRQPYRIALDSSSAKILDISPIFFSRANVDQFAIDRSTGEITWRHFDEGEGFRLNLIYEDQNISKVVLNGYAVDTDVIDSNKLDAERTRYVILTSNLILVWLSLGILYVLVIGFATRFGRLRRLSNIFGSIFAVISAGFALTIYAAVPTFPTPPF